MGIGKVSMVVLVVVIIIMVRKRKLIRHPFLYLNYPCRRLPLTISTIYHHHPINTKLEPLLFLLIYTTNNNIINVHHPLPLVYLQWMHLPMVNLVVLVTVVVVVEKKMEEIV